MEEKINCRIDYEAKHNPKCRIVVNGRSVHDFVADGTTESFNFEVANGPFDFRILPVSYTHLTLPTNREV